MLVGVLDDLDQRGLSFAFAGLKGPVKDRLKAYGLYDRIGGANFFPQSGGSQRPRGGSERLNSAGFLAGNPITVVSCVPRGGSRGTRTHNQRVKSPLLYQLS